MKILILCLTLFFSFSIFGQSTLITPGNNQPNILATSTINGVLPPRLTSVQRDAIINPTEGLTIYNSTKHCLEVYRGAGWFNLCDNAFIGSSLNKLLGGFTYEFSANIQQTSDGGYIVSGRAFSSSNGDVSGVNHGLYDYWILKLDIKGNIVWNKLLGGNNQESVSYLETTSDGGFIISGTSRSSANGDVSGTNHGGLDYWIVKLDAFGNIVWNKLLGGNDDDNVRNIQQTLDGGFIISGSSRSSANGDVSETNHGSFDYWIVKLDAFGNIIWNKLLGGNNWDESSYIQTTSDGGYIVTGFTYGSANGNITQINHGLRDYWIVKLDAFGNIMWNKLLGGNGDENIGSLVYSYIQQTSDGGFIISGTSTSSANGDVSGTNHGGSDYWIVKLDASGNIVWNKLLGGSGNENPSNIQQTSDGGFIISGTSTSSANGDVSGTNHGSSDYWIVKLDALGNIIWNKLLGGSRDDTASYIQQTSDGGYIVSGSSYSSASGDVVGTNHDTFSGATSDYWIIKLDKFGNIY